MATWSGTNNTISSTYTIPANAVHDFDPNVTTTVTMNNVNMVANGTLRMRPANPNIIHTLRFINVNENAYVGGGLVPQATDVGLWVMTDGVWDAIGTPKVGWNRTGDDPTWATTDEMYRVPWNVGDYTTFATHVKGTVPNSLVCPYGHVHTQEVFNVTRNVRVEGTPTGRIHIFIHSQRLQTIKYVSFRYTGPRQAIGTQGDSGGILGRYGLHIHHCFNGSRGSLYEGIVGRDSGSHAFVPHMSNGITMKDCVAFRGSNDAFHWDTGHPTTDLIYDHCLVAGITPPVGHTDNRARGFTLGVSDKRESLANNIIRDCVAVGVQGTNDTNGFGWPELLGNRNDDPDALDTKTGPGNEVWEFHDTVSGRKNVAHNNKRNGSFVWQNGPTIHLVRDLVAFRNAVGAEHGAYVNTYLYHDNEMFSNGEQDLVIFANSGGHQRFVNQRVQKLEFAHHFKPGTQTKLAYLNDLTNVEINEDPYLGDFHGGVFDLINCDPLEPSDWTITSIFLTRDGRPTAVYRVQRANGTAYQLVPTSRTTVNFTTIPTFAPWPVYLPALTDTAALGRPTITQPGPPVVHTPNGIPTGLAFGNLTSITETVVSTGIAATAALGNPTVTGGGTTPPPEGLRPPLRLRRPTARLRSA